MCREIHVLKNIRHPNIIQLYACVTRQALSLCNNLRMYTFVKALGPIFSSLSRDDPSLCSALACIAEKCDIITAMCVRNARPAVQFCNNLNMYKSQAAADETRFTVLHSHP